MKKLLAVLLVLVMALGLTACGGKNGGSNSAEKAAENFVSAYLEADAEALVNCVPEFMIDYLCEESGVDNKKELIESLESEIDEDDKKDYKILGAEIEEEISDREEFEEDFEEYDVSQKDLKKIDKVASVNVTVEVEGEEDDQTVICVKYDGKWYAMDLD